MLQIIESSDLPGYPTPDLPGEDTSVIIIYVGQVWLPQATYLTSTFTN